LIDTRRQRKGHDDDHAHHPLHAVRERLVDPAAGDADGPQQYVDREQGGGCTTDDGDHR
jgi:hypothetical protein